MTSSDPVKLGRPNRGAIFCAACPLGDNIRLVAGQHLPIRVPGGKGDARPLWRRGWHRPLRSHPCPSPCSAKVTKRVAGTVVALTPASAVGTPSLFVPTKQQAGLHRPGAGGPRPAGRQRSAQLDVGLLVNGPPWRQNVGPAGHRSPIRKRDHQRSSVIGKELGLAAHLLRGVVDIGDRGLPTRSHGKMGESNRSDLPAARVRPPDPP